MPNLRAAFLGLAASIGIAAPVSADSDATLQQIYDQARTGHLDQAQQMINQVLMDHPRSARAHFVAAELASRAGNLSIARGQLQQAEQLDPGLHFASAQAVRTLKAELGVGAVSGYEAALSPLQHSFPWFPGILLAALGLLIWAIVRRRSAAQSPYSGAPLGAGPYGGGYTGSLGGPTGGGLGSGIAGGLASGLALGAGVVAGEEVAHHFLDGNHHHEAGTPASPDAASNDNMGGNDFGVDDGGSWGDAGGGGGDWS
jgi:hypothetical protein